MKQITINRKYILQTWLWMLLLLFIACDDMEDKPSIPNIDGSNISETGTAELYILSEGLFNLNNSSLARYSFKKGKLTKNYFKDLNRSFYQTNPYAGRKRQFTTATPYHVS